MEKELKFFVLMFLILHPSIALNWQGTGNLNNDNLTVIWTYINNNFRTSWQQSDITFTDDPKLINFATGLSDYLNAQWDPAWNVFVVYIDDAGPDLRTHGNGDTVVYGYAFRNRWMWYNGVKMDDGYYVSFIIWKDYNCINWRAYSHVDPNVLRSTYALSQVPELNTAKNNA